MRWIFCLTLLLSIGMAYGGESGQSINGRLIRVDGNNVIIQLDQEAGIPNGSRIIFYEVIPGVGEVGVKGTWTVVGVQGTEVSGQPSDNSAPPQLGCSARILTTGGGSANVNSGNNSSIIILDTSSERPIDQWSGNLNTGPPLEQLERMVEYTSNLLEDPLVLKYQTEPYLGVYFGQQFNKTGAYIHTVMPNSTASEAGIISGDTITQFGRNSINSSQNLLDAIEQSRPGRNYTVQLKRNNQRMSLNLQMRTTSVERSCLKAGYDYDNGKGVRKDNTRAVDLFRKAAELGEPLADFALGMKYFQGDSGLPNDDKLFIEHLNKAAAQNCLEAMRMLGELYEFGEVLQQNQVLSREWYLKANDRGLIAATQSMAYMFYNGRGGPVNKNKAGEFFSWAASFGLAPSQVALGYMYYAGEGGLPRDWNIAEQWYQRAANQGSKLGQEWLTRIQQERLKWQQQQAQQQQQQQQQQVQRQRQQQQSLKIFIDTMKQFQNYRKR